MMKFKVSILGIVLALSYSMGNEFAELFSDYAFYEGYPAGTHPDRDGNPLNAYNRLHGLVKFEQDKGSSQATVLEGNYIDGKQDGVFQLKSTVYGGVVFEEDTYKNGQLDGESKRWVFIPKETDSPKEYHILVGKTLYEAEAEPKAGVPSKKLKSITLTSIGFRGKISETNHYCGSITLGIDDLTQGNEHHYEVVLHSQTLHKRYIERYAPGYGSLAGERYGDTPLMIKGGTDREYCITQYEFFETLLERFEKGEFNPFSNDSDYQVGKPFIRFVKYDGRDREEGLIAFQSEEFKGRKLNEGRVSEKIIETINDATYKLEFRPENDRENYITFTKNDMKIDPRVYNQEEFNTLLNKMYNKELSSFIAENLTKLKIN
ncbi:hypothetical protein [Helicobacter typhlonius]|uniref:hypothetical protein n=1 Tax=Helicobacter typhlonius TaxID=76936 RepID=UPI002FE3C99C